MLAERVKEWTSPWVEQGRQEGLQQGAARLLIRLLEGRFGAIDESYRLMITEADEDQLLLWSDRVLQAQSIEQVFARD